MEGLIKGVNHIIISSESQKKNRIQVSNTKKSLFFSVNLSKIMDACSESRARRWVVVKEGFETADKAIVAAEKGIKAVDKGVEVGIEATEKEITMVVRFGGLAQAGVEAVGVLIATGIVKGIIGPEAKKS